MRLSLLVLLASLLALSLTACEEEGALPSPAAEDAANAPLPEGCNPLAAELDCLLPWPSDVFLQPDPSAVTGRRLVFPPGVALESAQGEALDPTPLHPSDGFSHSPTILAILGAPVDPSGLVEGATLLLNAATGEAVPHFAELDPGADDPARQALFLRPMVRLDNATRYIVAIQGLTTPEGALIPAPAGFAATLAPPADADAATLARAERYRAEVLPTLEARGVRPGALQLAWDFTTQSMESAAGDLLAMREDALALWATEPPELLSVEVIEAPAPGIARRIEGTLRAPLYLEDPDDRRAPTLRRDAQGRVTRGGFVEVPFTMILPSVLLEEPEAGPARLVHYGHGFFSARGEVATEPAVAFANATRSALIAVDWWGFAKEDPVPIAEALFARPGEALRFVFRLKQSMINHLALEEVAVGALAAHPAAQLAEGPAYDPGAIYFYGISNGHILGTAYVALSPRIERAALSVGGGPYTFMMFRSFAFGPLLIIARQKLPDPLDLQRWVATLQSTFDPIDPLTWSADLLRPALPQTPAERRVLMQIGIGDALVPNLASHLQARTLGLKHLQPSPRAIPQLEVAESPLDGSALVEADFGLEGELPGTRALVPRQDNPVHEGVRASAASLRQLDAFLRPDGLILHTCDGPCDPE